MSTKQTAMSTHRRLIGAPPRRARRRSRASARLQESARHLRDLSLIETLRQPDLTLAQEVKPHRIGAVFADHLPRIDDVAATLRHLLAVHVEHVLVHDYVLVDQ